MWLWFDNGWCWWCCNSMEKLKLWNVIFLIASAEEKCSSASNSNDVIGRQPYINISLYRLIVGDINQINCILINCAFTHTHTHTTQSETCSTFWKHRHKDRFWTICKCKMCISPFQSLFTLSHTHIIYCFSFTTVLYLSQSQTNLSSHIYWHES